MNQISPITGLPVEASLGSYDRIIVAFSGGKDSLACLLRLIDLGVPRSKIELHHHDIDGHGEAFMDWPITPAYCQSVADALGVRLFFSYREGGFLREMLKTDDRSAPIAFDPGDGGTSRAGGLKGKIETRRRFPQQSANLAVRWCSGSLKIDVLDAVLRNSPRLQGKRLLVVTGERAEESPNRAKYAAFKEHRSSCQSRPTDHWLAVHDWSEAQVWSIIQAHGVVPHPAYRLGWARLSCMTCIFGSPNQWATIAAVFPEFFGRILAREVEFGVTIRRGLTVADQAAKGRPYAAALDQPALVALARSEAWTGPVVVLPGDWRMPAGAFGENAGPC